MEDSRLARQRLLAEVELVLRNNGFVEAADFIAHMATGPGVDPISSSSDISDSSLSG